jgi:hypothetical protein
MEEKQSPTIETPSVRLLLLLVFPRTPTKSMVRYATSREKLQQKLLEDLRTFPGCGGAESVVRPLINRNTQINWIIVFASGTSASGGASHSLRAIG